MTDPRVEAIRRAIMFSVVNTEREHPGYTHDDYDQAHAALEALAAEHRAWKKALEQIVARDVPTIYGGGMYAVIQFARDSLRQC